MAPGETTVLEVGKVKGTTLRGPRGAAVVSTWSRHLGSDPELQVPPQDRRCTAKLRATSQGGLDTLEYPPDVFASGAVGTLPLRHALEERLQAACEFGR